MIFFTSCHIKGMCIISFMYKLFIYFMELKYKYINLRLFLFKLITNYSWESEFQNIMY
ncbi:hypothetical protein JHK84_042737 [Glycine max]|nr:hypothetical protein JHK84_042737 [Glycine max]